MLCCQQLDDGSTAQHLQAVSGPAAWQLFLEATQDPAAKPNGGKAGNSMDTAGVVPVEVPVLSSLYMHAEPFDKAVLSCRHAVAAAAHDGVAAAQAQGAAHAAAALPERGGPARHR